MTNIGNDISVAKKHLENGNVVGVPTETVYGLAGNALDISACTKIFKVKNRPIYDPLIVHISAFQELSKYTKDIPEWAKILADNFWPGPLTFLLEKKSVISDLVTSGLSRVGIRMPSQELFCELLKSIDFPLAAPSANPFGYLSPTTAQHVQNQLGGKIPYVLDGGACQIGLESTIVGEEKGKLIIYRLGGLSQEKIEEKVGQVEVMTSSSEPATPGMLKNHYAPTKKILIGDLEKLIHEYSDKAFAVLSFQQVFTCVKQERQLQLSKKADLKEAGENLFSFLRKLDGLDDIDLILSEFVPEKDLGKAINDRLRRASA